ncbi:hypothetical protein [Comamonas sp.]|uniref:hypothetical protein n=1 Tax=Comamonas sp. TaxID=34028 RepID=UPI0028984745|nr:hypothetical protein [Comamonas sp.]
MLVFVRLADGSATLETLRTDHELPYITKCIFVILRLADALAWGIAWGTGGATEAAVGGREKFFNYFSIQVITFWISFGVQGNGAMQCRSLFPDHQDDEP